jgi:transposase
LQKRLKMLKLREILRLSIDARLSQNQIAKALHTAKGTVNQTLKRFTKSKVPWPLPEGMKDSELFALLYTAPKAVLTDPAMPDLDASARSMGEPGASIQRMYEDFSAENPNGLKRSQFFEVVGAHLKLKKIHLRMDRKPGEKLYIDFAGTMLRISPAPGVTLKIPIFVCSLGASGKSFALPLKDQSTKSVLGALTLALEFFDGCPLAMVPDNMKSMVIHASFFNPILNDLAARFCQHHAMVLLPARPYKPRDKALVENSVRHLGNLLLWRLRKLPIDSVERAVELFQPVVYEFNNRIMPLYGQSREERFLAKDKPLLQPLPLAPFELLRIERELRVGADYHVRYDGNFYSIPYTYANMHTDAFTKKKVVEFFIDGARVASHILREAGLGETVTNALHMPHNHRAVRFSGKEHRLEAASLVGPYCRSVAEEIFAGAQHEELAIRRCRHLSVLGRQYGKGPLEIICEMALRLRVVSPVDIEAMLKLGLAAEKVATPKAVDAKSVDAKGVLLNHEYLRGKAAFLLNDENKGENDD